ncbi:hypothetical protein FHL15_009589 [Xylaria flabelliformis]|uniref:RmlD-like substrate binding domain-containing protein n=1 Tax=Xylaria flabelliformis TaxID=2512241 RepID=A0A553HNK8_9PEZI|nr:hypothetical protein FHL15_009589 [Xylaria flabelliformis]
MAAKKALVTGATGFLGRQVVKAFERADWIVKGTGHSRADGSTILKVDLAKLDEVEAALSKVQPNVVVHCAANRFPDKVDKDPEGTRALNVTATESLASLCAARGILLIYISTDYVFPGKPGDAPYEADATPQPTNLYGHTKLDGERAVLRVFEQESKPGLGVVLRVPVLYGDAEMPSESAINILMDSVWKAQESDVQIKMDHWSIRYPTNTEDVGRVCHDVATKYLGTQDRSALPRILQFSSENKFTKYGICQAFSEIMGLPIASIEPNTEGNDPNAAVQRPYDCHLSTAALKQIGIDVSTQDFLAWWRWHGVEEEMDDDGGDIVLTNLGPLPTDFAVNSKCAGDLIDVYKYFTTSPGWYFLLQGPVEQTSCYPSGYTADSRQYYSPARCPTGFTSACQSRNVAGTVEETVVRCCPTHSSFTCQTSIHYSWEKTLGCTNVQEPAMTTWTVSQVTDGITALGTYVGAIGGVNAYQIQVGFQSTDFASSTSTPIRTVSMNPYFHLLLPNGIRFQDEQTESSTMSPTPTPRPTTQSATSLGSSSDHGGGGSSSSSSITKNKLSGGALAGVVVGALAGLLLVAALVWVQVRKRRWRQSNILPSPNDAHETRKREDAVELDAGEVRPSTNSPWPSFS